MPPGRRAGKGMLPAAEAAEHLLEGFRTADDDVENHDGHHRDHNSDDEE